MSIEQAATNASATDADDDSYFEILKASDSFGSGKSPDEITLHVELQDVIDLAEGWGLLLADIARAIVRDRHLETNREDKNVLAAINAGFNEALQKGHSFYFDLAGIRLDE